MAQTTRLDAASDADLLRESRHAVDQEIIGQDFLGQPVVGPGHG